MNAAWSIVFVASVAVVVWRFTTLWLEDELRDCRAEVREYERNFASLLADWNELRAKTETLQGKHKELLSIALRIAHQCEREQCKRQELEAFLATVTPEAKS